MIRTFSLVPLNPQRVGAGRRYYELVSYLDDVFPSNRPPDGAGYVDAWHDVSDPTTLHIAGAELSARVENCWNAGRVRILPLCRNQTEGGKRGDGK